MTSHPLFLNRCFDKSRLKSLILWLLRNKGEEATIRMVERLKQIGFDFATKAGVSLGVDDLKIPPTKGSFLLKVKKEIEWSNKEYERGNLTSVENFQQLVDEWQSSSEKLRIQVVNHFQSTDLLNPVYMMAFSGARGNISQVRQLVGMRGLMADPEGQLIDFPIRSNFREGLTLTEYMISCYGARKGLVDTALRTADAGYLTRRLVDVSHHIIVKGMTCGTGKGIYLSKMESDGQTVLSLKDRLLGRVLAEEIPPLLSRNHAISDQLAKKICLLRKQVRVRSPLTCAATRGICQLCYGWSLSQGKLVLLGEAVGVVAGQSIGEPGTQLTMRTFHTGGVFSGDLIKEIRAPHDGKVFFTEPLQGLLVRTSHGKVAFLTKQAGTLSLYKPPLSSVENKKEVFSRNRERGGEMTFTAPSSKGNYPDLISDSPTEKISTEINLPSGALLFARHKEEVYYDQLLVELSSLDKQVNERLEGKKTLFSYFPGEVYFITMYLTPSMAGDKDKARISSQVGAIWIISGRKAFFSSPLPVYRQAAHLINNHSLTSRRRERILSPEHSFRGSIKEKEKEGQTFRPLLSPYTFQRLTLDKSSPKSCLPVALCRAEVDLSNPVQEVSCFSSLEGFPSKGNSPIENGFSLTSGQQKANSFFSHHQSSKDLFTHTPLPSKKQFFQLATPPFISLLYRYGLGYCLSLQSPFSLVDLPSSRRGKSLLKVRQGDTFLLIEHLNQKKGLFPLEVSPFSYPLTPTRRVAPTFRKGGKMGLLESIENRREKSKKAESFSRALALWYPRSYKTRGGGVVCYDRQYFMSQGNGGSIAFLSSLKWKLSKHVSYWGAFSPEPLSSKESRLLVDPSRKGAKEREKRRNKTIWTLCPESPHLPFPPSLFSNPIDESSVLYPLRGKRKEKAHFQRKAFFTSIRTKNISPSLKWDSLYDSPFLKKTPFLSPLNKGLKSCRRQGWIESESLLARRNNFQGKKDSLISRIGCWSHLLAHPADTLFPLVDKERPHSKLLPPLNSTKKFLVVCNVELPGRDISLLRNKSNSLLLQSLFKRATPLKDEKSRGADLNPFLLLPTNPLIEVNMGGKVLPFEKSRTLPANGTGLTFPNLPFPFFSEKKRVNLSFLNLMLARQEKGRSEHLLLHKKREAIKKQEREDHLSQLLNDPFPLFVTTKQGTFGQTTIPLPEKGQRKVAYPRNVALSEKGKSINPLKKGDLLLELKKGWVYLPKQEKTLFPTCGVERNHFLSPPGTCLRENILLDQWAVYMSGLPAVGSLYPIKGFKSGKNLQEIRVARGKYKGLRNLIGLQLREKCTQYERIYSQPKSKSWNWSKRWINPSRLERLFSSKELLLFLRKALWIKQKSEFFTIDQEENQLLPVFIPALAGYSIPSLKEKEKREEWRARLLSFHSIQVITTTHSRFPQIDTLSLLAHPLSHPLQEKEKKGKIKRQGPQGGAGLPVKKKYLPLPSPIFFSSFAFKGYPLKKARTHVDDSYLPSPKKGKGVGLPAKQKTPLSKSKGGKKQLHRSLFVVEVDWFNKWSSELSSPLREKKGSTYHKRRFFMMIQKADLCSVPNLNQSKQQLSQQIVNTNKVDVEKKKRVTTSLFGRLGVDYKISPLLHLPSTTSGLLTPLSFHPTSLLRFALSLSSTELVPNGKYQVVSPLAPKKSTICSTLSTPQPVSCFSIHFDLLTPLLSSKREKQVESGCLFPIGKGQKEIESSSSLFGETVDPAIRPSFTCSEIGVSSSQLSRSPLTPFPCPLSSQEGNPAKGVESRRFLMSANDQITLVCSGSWQNLSIGHYLRQGDSITSKGGASLSGKVISIEKDKITLRKAQPALFYSKGISHVSHGQWIDKGHPLLTLTYQRLVTGDIVQGIPKIEQFFEAPSKSRGKEIEGGPQLIVQKIFKTEKKCYPLAQAVYSSLSQVQAIIVEGVQKVYLSQGVLISDKHVEIAVRGMSSMVKVVEAGDTGLLTGESFPLSVIEAINVATYGKRAHYEPIITGITNASLDSESFLSAASFQETTRVLSRSTLAGKGDFLRGLKERVVLGEVVQSGTGVDNSLLYDLLL